MLNTGAEVSLIQSDALPENYRTNGSLQIQKAGYQPKTSQVALVGMSIGKYNFIARCGIVEPDFINVPVILGHNLPGIDLEELLLHTRPRRRRNRFNKDTNEPSNTPQ